MRAIVALSLVLLFAVFEMGCRNNGNRASRTQGRSPQAGTTSAKLTKTILFFGNSLTAGYGLDDPLQAFPSLIQNKIDSLHLAYKTINAGVSGETSAGGNSRIDWVLKQPVNVFVLELGANDGLRGIPVAETRKNLQSIIDKVKKKYPNATLVLAGMQIPPSMGRAFATDFRNLYPELANKNGMVLIPFLLQGVGGEVSLNQKDGIHPTAAGHKIVAENVWSSLKDVLNGQ